MECEETLLMQYENQEEQELIDSKVSFFNSNRQTIKFRVSDAIKFAWKESIANLGNFFLIIIIFVIVQIIINIILGMLLKTPPVHTYAYGCWSPYSNIICGEPFVSTITPIYIINRIIFYIIEFVICTILIIGMYKVSTEIYNGGKASLKVFFDIKKIILRFIGGEVVASIYVGLLYLAVFFLILVMEIISILSPQIWLLILLIPVFIALVFVAVYLICAYYLWPLPMIANNSTIIRSFKESFKITKGNVGNVFWLIFLLGLINIAGAICLLVGLFVTIPMTYLAITYTYFTLKQNNN